MNDCNDDFSPRNQIELSLSSIIPHASDLCLLGGWHSPIWIVWNN